MKFKEKKHPVYINDEIREYTYTEKVYHLYDYPLVKKYFPSIYEEAYSKSPKVINVLNDK